MAKFTSKKIVETRNDHDIEHVIEEIPLVGKGDKTTKVSSYRVLTSKTRRIVKDRITSIEEARAVADNEPKPR